MREDGGGGGGGGGKVHTFIVGANTECVKDEYRDEWY